jgi:FkbM family methyltransferase
VLDVGAHVGSFAHAARLNGAALVHSYEPHRGRLAMLRANAARIGGVECFTSAILAEAGRGSWLGGGGATGGPTVVSDPDGPVEVEAFDDAFARLLVASPAGRVGLVKLDCEGGELPILLRSQRLAEADAVVLEWHPPLCEADVRALLERRGFTVETKPDTHGRGLAFATKPSNGLPPRLTLCHTQG